MAAKKPQPTALITYLCTRCLQDMLSADEIQDVVCGLCGKGDCLNEVEREPLTPQTMEAAMMKSVEKMMTQLQKAYDTKPADMKDDDEILLLQAMVKAKNLETHIQKVFGADKRKKPSVHQVRIKL